MKKNIIFIHGAWHGAWCWFKIVDKFEKFYSTEAIDLPGHGLEALSIFDFSVEKAVEKIKGYIEDGKKYTIIAHSAGGIVLSALAEKYPKYIEKAIYLAAFMVQNGESAFTYASIDDDSKVPPLMIDNQDGTISLKIDGIHNAFYNRTDDKYITLSKMLLQAESSALLTTPLTLGKNYNSVKKYYIKTMFDASITIDIQNMMIEKEKLPRKKVYTIKSDHSPFFSNLAMFCRVLNRVIRR